jgi:K(+)-stimulated pyrophosphate-energized sodium pump
LKLSGDRAKSVKDEMIKWVLKERLESEGYGEQFPVASNDTEEGKAKNRRIVVGLPKNEVHVVPYNFGTIISNLFE